MARGRTVKFPPNAENSQEAKLNEWSKRLFMVNKVTENQHLQVNGNRR